ncbi:MAG: S46 family peptidase, partial [Bryobacteraceae bacterium]
LRAYEDGKPAATPHYIKWSQDGVQEGDLVFSAGNPRTTQRLATSSELNFYRDTSLPVTIQRMQPLVQAVAAFAAKTSENAQIAQPTMTALLTSYKLAVGKLIGLRDDRLGTVKSNFENKVKRAVQESFFQGRGGPGGDGRGRGGPGRGGPDPGRDARASTDTPDLAISKDEKANMDTAKAWDDVSVGYQNWKPFEKPYQILEESPAPGSALFQIARELIRPAQRDERLLESDTVISDGLEILVLTQYLEELKALGEKEAPVKAILAGRTTAQAAEAFVKSSKLKDLSERRRLAASPQAVQKSEDGMIKLALLLEPAAQRLRKRHEDTIDTLDVSAAERIAQYRLKLFGAAEYPDATGTGRVEYGVVKAYTDRANVPAPFASTFSGLYYRRNNEGPYQVPKRWVDLQFTLDLVAPLDFVSTCDIGGGDYGGAVVNRAGELVGVTFDGNVESLPDTYLYSDESARAVHVAAQGIVQVLDKVYKATPLLQELGIGTGH